MTLVAILNEQNSFSAVEDAMPISITNPTVQRSLQQVTPVQDADLLNDPREQHYGAIAFAENVTVQPVSGKKIRPLADVALGAHFVSFGAPLQFNPCKLIHMNYAFKA